MGLSRSELEALERSDAQAALAGLELYSFGELVSIRYLHLDDGKYYEHEFKPGTIMTALTDGSLRIANPASKVWSDL